MTEAERLFLDEVREAIAAKDPERLSEAVSNFSVFCFKEKQPASVAPPFSDEFVHELMGLVGNPSFLGMEDSFKLVVLFQNDWCRLNPSQGEELSRFLETIFGKAKDPTV